MLDTALLKRLASFALGGVAAGCLAWIVGVQIAGRSEASELLAVATAHQAPQPMGRSAPATADLLAMALFSSTSGGVEVDPAAVQPVAPATALRLHGISISPRRRAALISTGGGSAIWFAEGQEGAGFTVQSIDRRRVTVAVAGIAQELSLYPDQADSGQPAGSVDATAAPAVPEVAAPPTG